MHIVSSLMHVVSLLLHVVSMLTHVVSIFMPTFQKYMHEKLTRKHALHAITVPNFMLKTTPPNRKQKKI